MQNSKAAYFITFMGWGAFIVLGLYGYFVFGPSQFDKGVLMSSPIPPPPLDTLANDLGAPDLIDSEQGEIISGEFVSLEKNVLSINVYVPSTENPLVKRDFLLTQNTELYKRTTTIVAEETDSSGALIQDVQVDDTLVQRDSFIKDKQVDVYFSDNSQGESVVSKVFIY
jgi:hypothetical protein